MKKLIFIFLMSCGILWGQQNVRDMFLNPVFWDAVPETYLSDYITLHRDIDWFEIDDQGQSIFFTALVVKAGFTSKIIIEKQEKYALQDLAGMYLKLPFELVYYGCRQQGFDMKDTMEMFECIKFMDDHLGKVVKVFGKRMESHLNETRIKIEALKNKGK